MRLLVAVFLAFCLTVMAGKKSKGGGVCKDSDLATFQTCLESGFKSSIQGCKTSTTDKKIKGKDLKKCKTMEKKLRKCGHSCEEEKSRATQVIEKCGHQDRDFPGADLFHKMYLSIEECVEDCLKTESCKSITWRTENNLCRLKSKAGGSSGPTVAVGHISSNMECERSALDLSCTRQDLGYNGADMVSLKSDGIEDCLQLCRDTENCKSITIRDSDSHCWLKSSRGGATGPYALANHRSLNLGCMKTKIDMSCLRKGINFYAADLRNLAVSNPEECAAHCADTEACKSFLYRDSNHMCYLKSKKGGAYPKIAAGDSSMNMDCDNTKIKNMECLRKGFNFLTSNFGVELKVADVEECIKLCRDTEDCKSLTYGEGTKGCWLRSRRGGSTGPGHDTRYDSMNLECNNGPYKNMDCLREGIFFSGADLRNLIVENKEECIRHCVDTGSCKSISFRMSDKRCYLKSRRGGSVPSINAGYSSMNMECDNSKITNLDCFREGYNFYGADMGNLVVADKQECLGHCRDTEDCKAVTFLPASKRCYLKNRRGGAYPRPQTGYNSMNLVCDNGPVKLDCLRRGVDFPGADIGNLIVANEEECVRHCRDTENCKSITFRESDHLCFLRHKRGGNYLQYLPGHNSLNLECENGKLEQLSCPVEDEKFPGHDLRSAVVEDVDTCLQWCRDTEGCAAASFNLNQVDNRCYMKTRKFEWWMFKNHYKSFNLDC